MSAPEQQVPAASETDYDLRVDELEVASQVGDLAVPILDLDMSLHV